MVNSKTSLLLFHKLLCIEEVNHTFSLTKEVLPILISLTVRLSIGYLARKANLPLHTFPKQAHNHNLLQAFKHSLLT